MRRLIACLLFLAPAAFAQDASQLALFETGQFEEAAYAPAPMVSADQLAFKARAVLAKGMCGAQLADAF